MILRGDCQEAHSLFRISTERRFQSKHLSSKHGTTCLHLRRNFKAWNPWCSRFSTACLLPRCMYCRLVTAEWPRKSLWLWLWPTDSLATLVLSLRRVQESSKDDLKEWRWGQGAHHLLSVRANAGLMVAPWQGALWGERIASFVWTASGKMGSHNYNRE